MSYVPMDGYASNKQNPFENLRRQRQAMQDDQSGESREINWSDVERALWAPSAVRHAGQEHKHAAAVSAGGEAGGEDLVTSAAGNGQANHGKGEQQDKAFDQPAKVAHSLNMLALESQQQAPHKFPELKALEAFLSPQCKLTHSFLPDGSSKTIQTAPDGSTRTQARLPDGAKEAKVADRYGRPVLVENMNPDGTWTVAEMTYRDSQGRISPFISSKRTTHSDGRVNEVDISWHGKVARRRDYFVGCP